MTPPFDRNKEKSIRMAIARDDYRYDRIAAIDGDLTGFRWLVATSRGLFAVDTGGYKQVMHGWYFGLVRNARYLFIFQNCGMWNRDERLGRILRIRLEAQALGSAEVIVKDLDPQCHQIRLIDDVLCVVDTANQCIRRFTTQGEPVDDITPFPVSDQPPGSSRYRHINSIARVGDRIGIMCHNGATDTVRKSAVAWLDEAWRLIQEVEIDGHDCHDIVLDHDGSIWHSASKEGCIISNDGRRIEIAQGLMTRGLALSASHIVVGLITPAPRSQRREKGGEVYIFDRNVNKATLVWMPAPPSDVALL